MSKTDITTAMILAAGLGTRLHLPPDAPPKSLTMLGKQPLLGHLLDRLEAAGVKQVVVNVHHKADAIEAFLAARYGDGSARYAISDERAALLETGGGVRHALPLLPAGPFFVLNSDMFWPAQACALQALRAQFDARDMRSCLLVVNRHHVSGVTKDDFAWAEPHRRLRFDTQGGLVYAGVQVIQPNVFAHAPPQAKFSFTDIWRVLAPDALYGFAMDGAWMHIGTPAGLKQAARRLADMPVQ